MILTAMMISAALHGASQAKISPAAPACLHEAGTETPDQQLRKQRAVGHARTINSAEAAFHVKAGTGKYGELGQLVAYQFLKPAPAGGQYVPGFDLHLDVTDKGYWFSVVDTTDACGFRFISNQDGLIFTAEPIR
jgi:hypothetical protein